MRRIHISEASDSLTTKLCSTSTLRAPFRSEVIRLICRMQATVRMANLSQQDPRAVSFVGAFLLYYSRATSYHSPGSMGKRTSRMPRPSVAATSDSTRVPVRLRRIVARGRSLRDQLFISKDWKCRHRSLVERPIHYQKSQGLIPSFF